METYRAKIIKRLPTTYLAEIKCMCGRKHQHGILFSQIGEPTHRVSHCAKSDDGYNVLILDEDIERWEKRNNVTRLKTRKV